MVSQDKVPDTRYTRVMRNGDKKWTCIVTDHVEPNLDWEDAEYRNAEVNFKHFQLRKASAEDLIDSVKNADVLIVDQAQISSEVISGLDDCQLIIRHGDGYDNLDLEAATEAGIVCVNQPGFWSREVAEQAFALGISLSLKIPVQQSVAMSPRTGANAGWDLYRVMPYMSLSSLTVGIVGCGKIGTITAQLFHGVAGRVLACDPYIEKEKITMAGAESASFDEVLKEADIISIHTPATKETIGMFNPETIGRMKPGSILINTARGPIVDTESVLESLKSGHLGGAGLDSTVPEPLPGDHPLFKQDNVILTPHLGWYSEDALWNMRKSILADALSAKDGRIPSSIRNPEVMKKSNLRIGKHRE